MPAPIHVFYLRALYTTLQAFSHRAVLRTGGCQTPLCYFDANLAEFKALFWGDFRETKWIKKPGSGPGPLLLDKTLYSLSPRFSSIGSIFGSCPRHWR